MGFDSVSVWLVAFTDAISMRLTNIVSISVGVKLISSKKDSVSIAVVVDVCVGVSGVGDDLINVTVFVVAVIIVVVEVLTTEEETTVVDTIDGAVEETEDGICESVVVEGDVKLVATVRLDKVTEPEGVVTLGMEDVVVIVAADDAVVPDVNIIPFDVGFVVCFKVI